MDLLNSIFWSQKQFQRDIGVQTEYILNEQKFHDALAHLVRASDEINEAARMLPLSFGGLQKVPTLKEVDLEGFTMEIVDSFLFMVNVLNIMGIDARTFIEMCIKKQGINVQRFASKQRFKSSREYPLIIIDGPDGVGKTEICQKLGEQLQIDVIRMAPPSDMKVIEDASRTFNETINQIKSTLILDRGFPSSIVYSQFFDRDVKYDYITNLFKDRDVFVFIIVADNPYRGDWLVSEKDFHEIKDLYIRLATSNKWDIINNNESTDSCVRQIISALQY